MTDQLGRTIDYLRISVTDKCNLRCAYCMPRQGVAFVPHEEILSLEEIYRLVRIMAPLGITRVRFTGGEPLVRKNLVKLIGDVGRVPGIRDIAMTTNGVLLAPYLEEMAAAGLRHVNISLDTCDRDNFIRITGSDEYGRVVEAVDRALALGLTVRLNCVPCREFNEAEIERIAAIARDKPVDVRFIELMPIGCGREYHGIPSDEILRRLERVYGACAAVDGQDGGGPAQYYAFNGFAGKVGLISPLSHKFCGACRRIRLTAEGRLKLCLHYDAGIELKPLLRQGCGDEEIRARIAEAVWEKPTEHSFESAGGVMPGSGACVDNRKMVQIGG